MWSLTTRLQLHNERYPTLQIERTISGCFHSSLSQLIEPGSDKTISAGVGVRPGYLDEVVEDMLQQYYCTKNNKNDELTTSMLY